MSKRRREESVWELPSGSCYGSLPVPVTGSRCRQEGSPTVTVLLQHWKPVCACRPKPGQHTKLPLGKIVYAKCAFA